MKSWELNRLIYKRALPPITDKSFRSLALSLVCIFLLGCVIWLIQVIPEWQVARARIRPLGNQASTSMTVDQVINLENEMRRTLQQAVAGVFAVVALYLTFRRIKDTEQGHITDRYTKAIGQLGVSTGRGKPNVEVRLGAIYALERIAHDSARDHRTVMEVLTAYVRHNAPVPSVEPLDAEAAPAIDKAPTTEIEAILKIVRRRRRDQGRLRSEGMLDLSRSDLRGAYFFRGYLARCRFYKSNIEGASFIGAHIEGASFKGATAKRAGFGWSYCEAANFDSMDAEGAEFYRANLKGASFSGACLRDANFDGANLEGADFRGAHDLRTDQIRRAVGWRQALFDEEFRRELDSEGEVSQNS